MYETEIDFLRQGKAQQALAMLLAKASSCKEDPAFYTNLAIAYEDLNQAARANELYEWVMGRWPDQIEAKSNYVSMCIRSAKLNLAESINEGILRKHPTDERALLDKAQIFTDTLRGAKALNVYQQIARLNPTQENWSRYLAFSIHFAADDKMHRAFADDFLPHGTKVPRCTWDGKRKIRIGVMGNKFCRSAVGSVLMPVLHAIDREKFEVFLYKDNIPDDWMTNHFLSAAYCTFSSRQKGDVELAQWIKSDGIDVLIDTMGHQAPSRMGVLLRRPAPVQMTYVGYAYTTYASEHIDQRVGWGYEPDPTAPPIEPLRHDHDPDWCVLGSVHRPAKINQTTMFMWAKCLERIPNTHLCVAVPGGESNLEARRQLEAHKIPGSRLTLWPKAPDHCSYLQQASRGMDVHLDCYPYTGGATTLDLAWMGVPTVSISSDDYKMGMFLHCNIGLGACTDYARNPQTFDLMTSVFCNADKLREYRRKCRGFVTANMNARQAAGHLEQLCITRLREALAAQPEKCCG